MKYYLIVPLCCKCIKTFIVRKREHDLCGLSSFIEDEIREWSYRIKNLFKVKNRVNFRKLVHMTSPVKKLKTKLNDKFS